MYDLYFWYQFIKGVYSQFGMWPAEPSSWTKENEPVKFLCPYCHEINIYIGGGKSVNQCTYCKKHFGYGMRNLELMGYNL